MTQTIIVLSAYTIFGIYISIISILRYLKFQNYKDDIKMRRKEILSSLIGMAFGIPVTIFFVYIISVLLL